MSPSRVAVESRIPEGVVEALAAKGHLVQCVPGWSHGRVLAIRYNTETGVMAGAASPRLETGYAMGY